MENKDGGREMKNWFSPTTEIPPAIGFGIITLFVLIGCLIQWRCGTKGVLVYVGSLLIIIGVGVIYLATTNKT
jgi:flagellar motor component MotA